MIQDRFKDAKWFGYPTDIVLGGAGGIGSWVALLLSRLQYRVVVYDFDIIESQNIGTQFYKKAQQDKGLKKATTVMHNCVEYGGAFIHAMDEAFTESSLKSHLMVSAFDNMKARKLFYGEWKKFVLENRAKEKPTLFVDGRMAAESGQVFFVKTLSEMELYEKTLFDDSEVEDLPCSYKATPHTGPLIGSLITSGIVNKVYNTAIGKTIREIPFNIEFDIASYSIKSYSKEQYETERL